MPRYRVTVRVEDYLDYIVEMESEDDAMRDANTRWWEEADDMWPDIEVREVDNDTPLGDVG